ncbi:hypothetical protein Pmani_029713 [Petrolisthes manimaculis]|uniref:Uncharacterized protein n=1 Tax=Petrolisthes manimaculis TaxID=1843537 RepID=A0AAE1NZ12_9EUCA|nr:hypothetical protein Pmani_029713 [Petrolisthes manimaculis]
MRRSFYSQLEGGGSGVVDVEAQVGDTLLEEEQDTGNPSWANLRAKILSFTRNRSKSPNGRSPGSRSPTARSPAALSPRSRSPTICRSPIARSPTSRSPILRSPTGPSPSRSPTNKSPPLRSPTQRYPPPLAFNKRGSYSRGSSRESWGSRDSPNSSQESAEPQGAIRNSGSKVKRCLKKAFSLNLEAGEGLEGTELESPGAGATGGRKVKLKIRSSPVEQVMELTQLEEEAGAAEAARRTRKWSYHGIASPTSPVETPKRHSFSTGSGDRAGIVVTNNDLASLLTAPNHLTPPGSAGLPEPEPLEPAPPPRARGRSQSIAVCSDAVQSEADGPQAPITIRRTDCDHVSVPMAPLESTVEEEEEPGWESSGANIDPSLLGSVIEQFLKTTRDEEDVGEVTSALTSLQVK